MAISTSRKVHACDHLGLPAWGFHSEADIRAAARRAFLLAHPDKTSAPDNGKIAAIRRARGALLEGLKEDVRREPMVVDR